jgi:hypothetical protein
MAAIGVEQAICSPEKNGTLVLDAFKGNVMSKIRATISLINTDLLSYLEDHPQKNHRFDMLQ